MDQHCILGLLLVLKLFPAVFYNDCLILLWPIFPVVFRFYLHLLVIVYSFLFFSLSHSGILVIMLLSFRAVCNFSRIWFVMSLFARQCFNVSLVFVNLCWFFLGSPNSKPCKRLQHLVSSLVFIVSLHFVLQSCLDSLCLYCNLYFFRSL